MNDVVIEAEGLGKRYGPTGVVARVSPQVADVTALGVLGPNGAGRTAPIRMLTAPTRQDAGWARGVGHDVVPEAKAVRV